MASSLPRFCLVGLSNALVGFAVFTLLTRVLPAVVAQALAYSAGILWSYFWNRRWAFRHSGRSAPAFTGFVAVQVALLGMSSGLIGVSVDLFHLPSTPSWLAVMALITVTNYLLLRFWVFSGREAEPQLATPTPRTGAPRPLRGMTPLDSTRRSPGI